MCAIFIFGLKMLIESVQVEKSNICKWGTESHLFFFDLFLLIFENRRQNRHFDIHFLGIFDPRWPWMTSRHVLLESWRRERHFKVRILTINDPKFVIWPQTRIFLQEIIFRFYWSFWAFAQDLDFSIDKKLSSRTFWWNGEDVCPLCLNWLKSCRHVVEKYWE